MTYVRVYAGRDGESHLEEVAVPMKPTDLFPGLPTLFVAAPMPATSLILVRFPEEAGAGGWRRAPRRQMVVFGSDVEIEVSDGEVRRVCAGNPVLFEDTFGKGHDTRMQAAGETLALFIPLADC